MQIIDVNDEKTLKDLYDNSAFTLEGVAPTKKNVKNIFDWLKKHTGIKNETAYAIPGSLMNRVYNLTGNNAYPKTNCHLVCVKLDDMEDPMATALPRFQIGARWFDDIVENNARREEEKSENFS